MANRRLSGDISEPSFTDAAAAYLERVFPDAAQTPLNSGMLILILAKLFQNDCEKRVHRPIGLGWTAYSVLFTLDIFGQQQASYLARVAGVSRQAISTIISGLERESFVIRVPGVDRRTQDITLTDKGKLLSFKATSGQVEVSERWMEELSIDEQEQFLHLVLKLISSNTSDSFTKKAI